MGELTQREELCHQRWDREYHGATEKDQTLRHETLPARVRWALANETLQARVTCTPPQALAKENQLARVQ